MGDTASTNNTARSSLMVIGAGALWGCISLFVRALNAAGLDPFEISGVRLILGAVGMAIVLLIKDRSLFRIRPRDIWMFIGTGVISVTLFNICYFACISLSEASVAVVLLYTSPIWVMLMSAIFFRERITAPKLVALAMTFVGCALVAGIAGGVALTPSALCVGLVSGIFYATYSIFGRVALERYNTMTITFWTFFMGAICALFISNPAHIAATFVADPKAAAWGLGIGVVCTIIPYLLYTKGLQGLETGRAAILATVEPLVGAVLGIFLYGESTGMLKIVGMLLILGAVIVLNIPSRDKYKS